MYDGFRSCYLFLKRYLSALSEFNAIRVLLGLKVFACTFQDTQYRRVCKVCQWVPLAQCSFKERKICYLFIILSDSLHRIRNNEEIRDDFRANKSSGMMYF